MQKAKPVGFLDSLHAAERVAWRALKKHGDDHGCDGELPTTCYVRRVQLRAWSELSTTLLVARYLDGQELDAIDLQTAESELAYAVGRGRTWPERHK